MNFRFRDLDIINAIDVNSILNGKFMPGVFQYFFTVGAIFRNRQKIDHIICFIVNELIMFAVFFHHKEVYIHNNKRVILFVVYAEITGKIYDINWRSYFPFTSTF